VTVLQAIVPAADVLIAGERFGVIRDAFIARGIPAISCDQVESQAPGPHIVGDWTPVINSKIWRLIIIHPTCTKVTVSGNGTYAAGHPRHAEPLQSAAEIAALWHLVKSQSLRAALENPVGVLPTLTDMGRPRGKNGFTFQPHEHGADASKLTCVWVHGLPALRPTAYIGPRLVCCGKTLPDSVGRHGCPNCGGDNEPRPRWANQTDSGQNKLGPTADPTVRQMARAETYPGVAAAMADQWGPLLADAAQADFHNLLKTGGQ